MKRKQRKEFKQYIAKRKAAPSKVSFKKEGKAAQAARAEKKTRSTSQLPRVTGTFRANPRGFGFVTPTKNGDDPKQNEHDIFIASDCTMDAMNKDTVEVEILRSGDGDRSREGRIIRIVERGVTEVVGTFRRKRFEGWVISDDPKFTRVVVVDLKHIMDAKNGDKVVCKLTGYGSRWENPRGRITEILGHEDEAGTDILSIARAMDLPMVFPDKVQSQAERIPDHVIEGDYAGREDLRDWRMVTIDGPDAKDLDDAVSLTKEGEDYILGVHIADVSNYVQENSALDREALRRGTSVYLADRVIPMLPERLSNGICSLNAGCDRLALSCIMTLDKKGRVKDHRIVESVIRVGERMSYPDVRAILEDRDEALMEKYSAYVPMFRDMYELSLLIRARRESRGAIDFDFPEAKVLLNEDGIPTEIVAEEANCATRIIEDFMLTANETVAKHFCEAEIPFVYRVHGDPDPEKIENVLAFVRKQGVGIQKTKQKITPREIQNTLNAVKGEPSETMISRIILRSMQQARYETSCDGHFGLAAEYYCHFTSPIRRYPDLQIHRIIHDCIRGRMSEDRKKHYAGILDEVADQSSLTERRAAEVERETVKLKKAQYMLMHVGESFEGVISSVTSWGIYVELPNTVEGLVRAADMLDDYYNFDETKQAMIGRLSRKEYRLGDPVRVIMISADLTLRTINFEMDDSSGNTIFEV